MANMAAVQQALGVCGANINTIQTLTVTEGLDSIREFGLLTKDDGQQLPPPPQGIHPPEEPGHNRGPNNGNNFGAGRYTDRGRGGGGRGRGGGGQMTNSGDV